MRIVKYRCIAIILSMLVVLSACGKQQVQVDLSQIEYKQESYITVNDNIPQFNDSEITTKSFETYSDLDELGRCGVAFACIGQDIMPTEERGAIGQIKPSGWQMAKYDIVDGKYLYNRCHLIGYQLTGENANPQNLITGTRSMNVDGMLPYENMVADYIDETNNHVMYRVTPVYDGNNLLAKGVQMEAYSVEDEGEGISFNVFVFNAQPGIRINYSDGTSELINENYNNAVSQDINVGKDTADDEETSKKAETNEVESCIYILNTSTKKIHYQDCPSVDDIQSHNKETFNGTKNYLIQEGYSPCGRCRP